jgi:hypothetical protein
MVNEVPLFSIILATTIFDDASLPESLITIPSLDHATCGTFTYGDPGNKIPIADPDEASSSSEYLPSHHSSSSALVYSFKHMRLDLTITLAVIHNGVGLQQIRLKFGLNPPFTPSTRILSLAGKSSPQDPAFIQRIPTLIVLKGLGCGAVAKAYLVRLGRVHLVLKVAHPEEESALRHEARVYESLDRVDSHGTYFPTFYGLYRTQLMTAILISFGGTSFDAWSELWLFQLCVYSESFCGHSLAYAAYLIRYRLRSIVTHIHSARICHGDVRPANIARNRWGTVMLIDFSHALAIKKPGSHSPCTSDMRIEKEISSRLRLACRRCFLLSCSLVLTLCFLSVAHYGSFVWSLCYGSLPNRSHRVTIHH